MIVYLFGVKERRDSTRGLTLECRVSYFPLEAECGARGLDCCIALRLTCVCSSSLFKSTRKLSSFLAGEGGGGNPGKKVVFISGEGVAPDLAETDMAGRWNSRSASVLLLNHVCIGRRGIGA